MSALWPVGDVGLDGVDRVAAFLALVVAPGDLIALRGDLGTGKTTFARLLIGHMAGAGAEEIPSPTFALAQSYETGRTPVLHVDCYRLTDVGEAAELGMEEALETGAVLVEWPERIEALLPADRLDIQFADGAAEDTRVVTLTGLGAWAPRIERLTAMEDFCSRSGWGAAHIAYLQGDASTRSYARLHHDGSTALLVNSPKTPDGPPVRGGKPYSAIANLAEDVKPFVAVATALRAAGFVVPEILAHDLEQGFLVIEDLGDRLYGAEIAAGADAGELYRAATDVLVALRQLPVPDRLPLPDGTAHVLPPYDGGALQIEVELLLDWFWPLVKGEAALEAVRANFLAAWRPLFDRIGEESPGWVLRDYHSPNLIWLPERGGIARVGILDFQDALKGPCVYDLVSLAQDARRDVPETLEAALTEHYCAGVGAADASFDRDRFTAAYAILGAQRSTKILGIFARLALRDAKPGYIDHIPRVSAYLERNLVHASLADLRAWYERHLPAETRERAGRA